MCFEDDNRDKSASASDSDNMEATDENGRLEEERGNEHNWNNDSNEAEELWRALAMSLVAAVGGGGEAASEGIYHGGDGGRFDVIYVEINEK